MPPYFLFLVVDGVEIKVNAYQSIVKSPRGNWTKIWYLNEQDYRIDTALIDRLNEEIKDVKFKVSLYQQDVIEYGTFAISSSSPRVMDFIELYKYGVEFEEPKPIDRYANNPTKELCFCKKNIATSFYFQWWCDECHKKQNW